MENLAQEARQHIAKLEKSIQYHSAKLESDIPDGAKHMHQLEVDALQFVIQYAREALMARGINV